MGCFTADHDSKSDYRINPGLMNQSKGGHRQLIASWTVNHDNILNGNAMGSKRIESPV